MGRHGTTWNSSLPLPLLVTLLKSVKTRGIEIRAVAEGAVGVAMNVVLRPEFAVGSCGTDIKASTAQCVKEQGSAPTIDQLAFSIEGDMIVGKKSLTGGIFSTKKVGPVFVGAEGSIGGGFQKEPGIVHEPGHESKVVLWRKISIGVVAKNGFAQKGRGLVGGCG